MKYFFIFLILIFTICNLLLSPITNEAKANSLVVPKPPPSVTKFNEAIRDIKGLDKNLEERVAEDQASKISLLKNALKTAKNNILLLEKTAEEKNFSESFKKELNDNFQALSILENKKTLDKESIQQIQDITEDLEIKADPSCDEEFDITIFPSKPKEEESYKAYYVNVGKPSAEGTPFASGNSVRTTGKVHKGKKYFWLEDSNGNKGKREQRRIFCSEPKEFPLSVP